MNRTNLLVGVLARLLDFIEEDQWSESSEVDIRICKELKIMSPCRIGTQARAPRSMGSVANYGIF